MPPAPVSGIRHPSPLPEHSLYRTGSGIDIPVPDRPGVVIPAFKKCGKLYNTPCTSKLQVAERDKHCTVHARLLLVLYLVHDVEKIIIKWQVPECRWKSYSGIGIFTVSQMHQSCIVIPAAGWVRYRWWSALVQHCSALILWLPVSDHLTLGCHEEGGAVPLHQRLCGVDQRQAIRNSILNKCTIIY